MIKEAINRLLELNTIDAKEISGQTYVKAGQNVVRLRQPDQADVDPLRFNTLSGLVNYIGANLDPITSSDLVLHVVNYNDVRLIGPIDPKNDNRRFCYAMAQYKEADYLFDRWMQVEDFIINLQTCFDHSRGGDAEAIIDLVGRIASEHVRENKDDGFSQTIQIKSGLTVKSEHTVKNPVNLYPWRTFREIDQPLTPAILRFKETREKLPNVALFVSKSDHWRIEAIQSIKAWLNDHVEFLPILA